MKLSFLAWNSSSNSLPFQMYDVCSTFFQWLPSVFHENFKKKNKQQTINNPSSGGSLY